MPLFTQAELTAYVQDTSVTSSEHEVVERVVAGWLAAAGVPTAGTPAPEVFSWAVRLGGLVWHNPGALASRSIDGITDSYDRDAATAILAEARSSPIAVASSASAPRGRFPAAPAWPDPIVAAPRSAVGP